MPAHAVAQQTPWAQNPDAHSVAAAQVWPRGFFEQVPPLHTLGATQSVLAVAVVHVVLHTLAVVSQRYAPHDELVAAEHVPVPLQSRGGVKVEPVHVAAAHCVPLT